MKKEEKEIEACPFCLTDDIDYFNKTSNFLWIKQFPIFPKCKKCQKNIQPIIFHSREEYEKAKKELGK